MAQLPADRTPVIVGVGVGEVTARPADPLEGKEPIALMAEGTVNLGRVGGLTLAR